MKNQLNLTAFVPPYAPILTQVAHAIPVEEIVTLPTKTDIDRMLNVAYGEQKEKDKPLLVGLAAPQIGIPKRIILVDVIADGKGKVGELCIYINPEIISVSDDETEWYEGCYSTSRVCGIVSRPNTVRFRAYTQAGEAIESEYSGYTARIIQHEIDHLNGKVFVDRISNDRNLHWVESAEFPQYRNLQGWRTWPNTCSRERWLRIKNGQ